MGKAGGGSAAAAAAPMTTTTTQAMPSAQQPLAPLPSHIEERVDPSSGRTFYINPILETSWERPRTQAAHVSAPPMTPMAPVAQDRYHECDESNFAQEPSRNFSNQRKLQSQQCPGRGVADVHFDGISREHQGQLWRRMAGM